MTKNTTAATTVNPDALATEESLPNPEVQVGTVLVSNIGYSMILPVFYRVVRRTAKTMWVKRIRSIDVNDDGHGFTGYSYADLSDDSWMRAGKSEYISSRLNGSYLHVNNHLANVWDGSRRRFDHLD